MNETTGEITTVSISVSATEPNPFQSPRVLKFVAEIVSGAPDEAFFN